MVEGINLITYDKAGDDLTNNDFFQALLETARERGFVPACVVFDSWYGSLANLKRITGWGWIWLTRLKANRPVNPDRSGLRPVARVETGAHGAIVPLKGYGLIRLFQIVAPDGDKEWWARNDLRMSPLMRVRVAGYASAHARI